jgi:anti-sigma B factor antagonist
MELSVSQEQGYVLARTSGTIDESAGEPFREHLHPLVATKGTRLILDISDSPRISSSGIAQLVRLVTDANSRGSRVVFTRVPTFIEEVFRVTRLNKLFDLTETLSEAVEKVSTPSSPA